MNTEDSVNKLRERRLALLKKIEDKEKRERNGKALVDFLALSTSDQISIDDFDVETLPPFSINWPRRIEDAEGLVAAYVAKDKAKKIAGCIESKMDSLNGLIGFYDKDYLGLCKISRVSMGGMVDACALADDTVVFYPDGVASVIAFDCYKSNPGEAFSVVVQGAVLGMVIDCFK